MSESFTGHKLQFLPCKSHAERTPQGYAFSALFVMFVAYAASTIGILTRPDGMLAAFWLTNAVLLGLFVRCPRMVTALSVVTAFAGYVLADLTFGSTLQKSILLTTANLSGVMLGYLLFMQLDEEDRELKRARSVLFMVVIIFLASLVAGICGAAINPILFNGRWQTGLELWLCTEFTNFTAVLPVILTMPNNFFRKALTFVSTGAIHIRLWRLVPAASVVLGMMLGNFLGGPGAFAFPVPALIWCALSYPLFSTTVVALVFSVWTLMAISQGYINLNADVQEHYSLLSIRLGVAMISLTPLTVGSIMVTRLELLKRLDYLANYDTLTSVLNRNGFYREAARVWERLEAASKPAPISLLVLDLDNFKSINDEFGHAGGDVVIREFAQGIQNCIRKHDAIGRWGGEEFVVLLPECPGDNALRIAEQIRADLEARVMPFDGEYIRCTASIGVAVAPDSSTNLATLLKRADEALYRAKDAGRNQVMLTH